jgi:SAM-dependent methyltransferase
MTASSAYVYADHADRTELDRLRLLEASADDSTNRVFDRIGVGAGWTCLEVAAGAGSVARGLAQRVGPSGHVVAVDIDLRFLGPSDKRLPFNLEVRQADVLADDLGPGGYDLVHTRHLLAHLGRRAGMAIERMAGALRPGGWLVVEDIDLGRIAIVNANPGAQAAVDVVLKAMRRIIVDRDGDPRIGLRLPVLFEEAGLADIGVDARLPYVRGDSGQPLVAVATLRALRPQLIERGVPVSVFDTALAALSRPGCRAFDPVQIAVWGRR